MIKYKASVIHNKVTKVEVVRETEKFVVINYREREFREAKIGEYGSYFDYFDDAKNWLAGCHRKQMERHKVGVEYYSDKLDFAISMEPPKDD